MKSDEAVSNGAERRVIDFVYWKEEHADDDADGEPSSVPEELRPLRLAAAGPKVVIRDGRVMVVEVRVGVAGGCGG